MTSDRSSMRPWVWYVLGVGTGFLLGVLLTRVMAVLS